MNGNHGQTNATSPNTTAATIGLELPFRDTVTKYHRSIIAQLLFGAEVQSKYLADEVERLRRAIMILEGRRQEVEEKIKAYKSLMAPVHRMPPEVMMEIFKFVCATKSLVRWPVRPDLLMPPTFKLSMVCGRWREITIASPFLWSSINVDRECGRFNVNMYRAAKIFLERSKNQTIKAQLQLPSPQSPDPHIFDLFLQESIRWREVSLCFPYIASTSISALGVLRGHLPVLTKLELTGLAPLSHESLTTLFELAPSLHSLYLGINFVSANLRFPWQQIRSIRLRGGLNEMWQILKLCHNVEEIRLESIAADEFDARHHLDLPETRSWSITVTSATHMVDVLRQITCPNLGSLEIWNHSCGNWTTWNLPWDASAIAGLLSQPTCRLTSLRLGYIPLTDVEVISLLRHVPTLQSLYISEKLPPSHATPPEFDRLKGLRPRNMIVTASFLRQLSFPHQ
ncbi:hypothetical protein L218DRAFT_958497 [Marasmius fiardii PR-910]|nr:hypothetical protein L218DRAFT_958497 [Marasmius fiardii PR-910]